MLPDKRKKIMIATISIFFLILVVLGVSFLTKTIKKNVETPFISDAYPQEVIYIGVQHDSKNDTEVLSILNGAFEKTTHSLSTFYKISDYKVINNRLVIYSDAINEIAYKANEDEFIFNEIDSFYSNRIDVRLANDYVVFLTDTGALEYRNYNANEKGKNKTIATDLDKENFIVIKNIVFYRDIEGIVGYNMDTEQKSVVIAASQTFYPYIVDANEQYVLTKSNDRYAIYDINSNTTTYINETLSLETINIFSLFNKGIVYEKNNPYALEAYNVFFKRKEGNPYNIQEGYKVSEMYNINESNCYLDLVDEEGNHEYYIFNITSKKIIATLSEGYDKIIKIQ